MKSANIKAKSISKTSISQRNQRKELKMAKSRNRIKKMTFQTQERTFHNEPLSDNDKYIIEMAGYKRQGLTENEDIHRTTGGSTRPQYI